MDINETVTRHSVTLNNHEDRLRDHETRLTRLEMDPAHLIIVGKLESLEANILELKTNLPQLWRLVFYLVLILAVVIFILLGVREIAKTFMGIVP